MVAFTDLPPPTEGVRYVSDNVHCFLETKDMGNGTVYITESSLSWRSESGNGFSLHYPAISLHAISRDTTNFAHKCVYLMVDATLIDNVPSGVTNAVADQLDACSFGAVTTTNGERPSTTEVQPSETNNDDAMDSDNESLGVTEIRFVPTDETALDLIFQHMADCQALHPDENDDFSDEDDFNDDSIVSMQGVGDFINNQDPPEGFFDEHGQAQLHRFNQMLASGDTTRAPNNQPDEQFEDAPDDMS